MTVPKDKSWWKIDRASRNIGTDEEEREHLTDLELAATYIAEKIHEIRNSSTENSDQKIALLPHLKDFIRFLENAEIIHKHVWDEWEALHGVQGSAKRPHKSLKKNYNDKDVVQYDYGELRGGGFENWSVYWKTNYSRSGARNPGTFRHPLEAWPKAPLVAVYHGLNEWWLEVLDQPFWPDFSAVLSADDDDDDDDEIGLSDLGVAALMFFLVAQEMYPKYKLLHCKRVHDDEYRFLKHKKAQ